MLSCFVLCSPPAWTVAKWAGPETWPGGVNSKACRGVGVFPDACAACWGYMVSVTVLSLCCHRVSLPPLFLSTGWCAVFQVCLACKGCAGTDRSLLWSVCLSDDAVGRELPLSVVGFSGPGGCVGDANTGHSCRPWLPSPVAWVPFAGHACSLGFLRPLLQVCSS